LLTDVIERCPGSYKPLKVSAAAVSIALLRRFRRMVFLVAVWLAAIPHAGQSVPVFRDLFDGKDLTGWVKREPRRRHLDYDGRSADLQGQPLASCVRKSNMRTSSCISNGSTSKRAELRVFVWNDAKPGEKNRLPNGVEVEMLELDAITGWNGRDGQPRSPAYVHGDLFGAGGVEIVPDNPRR
jgi:hypothetical protein